MEVEGGKEGAGRKLERLGGWEGGRERKKIETKVGTYFGSLVRMQEGGGGREAGRGGVGGGH